MLQIPINHRHIGAQLETPELRAIAHVVVENQAALGEVTPVPDTLERLLDEGFDRHEAVHAIGSVLMGIMLDTVDKPDEGSDMNARYNRELALLTAADWDPSQNEPFGIKQTLATPAPRGAATSVQLPSRDPHAMSLIGNMPSDWP